MEGGSNGHRSYEMDFSVRYLAGASVVIDVHVAAVDPTLPLPLYVTLIGPTGSSGS